MSGLHPAIIVFATLAFVAIAAIAFQPSEYLGQWKKLADRYATQKRPKQFTYPEQDVLVGNLLRNWRFWANDRSEYATFDAEVDDDGLWLRYHGPEPEKSAPCLFIPGTSIGYLRDDGESFAFEIDAAERVQMVARKPLGAAIKWRCQGESGPPVELDA